MSNRARANVAMPLALLGLTAAGVGLVFVSEGYTHFILALVALTAVVGVGLNVLLGLAGQVSLGHVGFYAIGAYTAAILTVKGVSFWLAFPAAGLVAGAIGALLALPALRVTGPYLAMVTIAFAFIVHHGTVEWKDLTGGQNGLMGLVPPAIGSRIFGEREMALMAILLAGLSLYLFHRIAASAWGKAMVAVRESETAARSVGLNPVSIKTVAFAISAVFAGLAGAIFAPLMMFVAPNSFPFSQSILFLLAVIVGGSGWVIGPVVGAVVTVLIPEMLSHLAEYRLLMVGVLLLVVLWLAPEGIVGTLARYLRRTDGTPAQPNESALSEFLSSSWRAACADGVRHRHRVRRREGRVRRQLHGRARPHHQRHRTERSRQDDRAQHHRWILPAGRGQHTARRHRACRRAGLAHRPHRHRAHLPDRATVRHDECAGQCTRGAAARTARQPVGGRRDGARPRSRRKRSSPSSAITVRSPCWRTLCRTSIAASSRSRARSPPGRACCCLTSPPRA